MAESVPPDRRPSALLLERATVEDLDAIRALAREIWTAFYPGIISPAQIDYMLERMYDPAVIRREMTEESVDYFLMRLGADPEPPAVGFAAIGPGECPGEMSLHKLYLHPGFHGRGHGTLAIEQVVELALSRHACEAIVLRVNRRNERAIRAYLRNGFEIDGEICSDIGGGFVMDDFRMRKTLRAGSSR